MNWASQNRNWEKYDVSDIFQRSGIINLKKKFMSNNIKAVLGALVSGVLVAVLGYLLSVGDIWKISFHSIVNIGVMAFAGSLLKFVGTTKQNNFVGTVPLPTTPTN
jgi:hypothetical protein